MKTLLLIAATFVSISAHAELSATAGQTLMESFRCESTNGSAVQTVRNSLTSLKSTLEKIAEQQKECLGDFAGVGKLPEIDSILSQIENYGVSEDIKKQENVITEALTDLARLKQIPINHPDRNLYPDEATLQSIVAQARADLISLRAQYGVDRGKADRKKYLDGVRQLDLLATELSTALQKNSQCFQKNPILRKQVMGGLVGIAGFFAKTPAGIGITLAGRVLQNIFNVSDSAKINDNMNFEASNQTMLAAGMACTMENLSTQHCRLVRQNSLFQQLKEPACRGSECSAELKQLQKLVASGRSATDAVAAVTSWIGGKSENTSDQAIASKVNSDFLSATSKFEAPMAEALDKARQGEASSLSEVQKQNQFNAVQKAIRDYSKQIYGKNFATQGETFGGMYSSEEVIPVELQSMFTTAEKRKHVLNLLFDDKEYESLLTEAMQTINASARLRQKFGVEGVGGIAGSKSVEEAAIEMLHKTFGGVEYPDIPAAQKVKERMSSRVVFDRVKARLAQYRSQILQRTAVQPKDEQLGNFLMAFQQEDLGKPSTLKNLESIQTFFGNLPEDYVKSRDGVLNISALKQEVDDVVNLGRGLDSGSVPITKEKVADLLAKTNRLLDPSRGFKERLTNIASSAASYQTQKISRSVKNPSEINDLVFLQNKDFIEQVYDLRNPYEREMDTKTAIALSASQIDSFGKFFENYMDPALQVLNKKNIRDSNFSDGLAENIDRSLKDHFCIQALGLTSIPEKIKNECGNARLKMGSNELRFDDYARAPHQERVCAYRNFLHKVDIRTTQRQTNSGAQ